MVIVENKHVPFFKPDAVKAVIELVAPPTSLYTCHRMSTDPSKDILTIISTKRNRTVAIEVRDDGIFVRRLAGDTVTNTCYQVSEIYIVALDIVAWLEGTH